jgi:hypothetical protein
MSKWITQRGETLEPFAQPTQMECWIASYRMILQANGLNYSLDTIEQKLSKGGFSQAKQCRAKGLADEELKQAAEALKMGSSTTKAISNFQGLKNMLMMGGPLWVAGMFEMTDNDGVKRKYKHVIAVVGVDEEYQSICWINPWKWNAYDEPSKGWIGWDWFYQAITNTFNIEGSLQYLTPIQAAVLSVTN